MNHERPDNIIDGSVWFKLGLRAQERRRYRDFREIAENFRSNLVIFQTQDEMDKNREVWDGLVIPLSDKG